MKTNEAWWAREMSYADSIFWMLIGLAGGCLIGCTFLH